MADEDDIAVLSKRGDEYNKHHKLKHLFIVPRKAHLAKPVGST
jgi:hypothetical protein